MQISPFQSSFPWCVFPIFSSPLIPDLFRGRQGDHAGWVGSLIRTSSIFPCCLPCPIQRVCPRGKRFHFLGWRENMHFSHFPHTAPKSKARLLFYRMTKADEWAGGTVCLDPTQMFVSSRFVVSLLLLTYRFLWSFPIIIASYVLS